MLQEEEKSLEKKLAFENTSMPNSPCSIPATPDEEEDSSQNKRRLGSGYQMAKLTLAEAKKRKGANLTRTGLPRWHNQSYMLFVSLRQHSEKTMSRTDLIKKALDFDKKISQERNLPRVFRGKVIPFFFFFFFSSKMSCSFLINMIDSNEFCLCHSDKQC